MLFAYSVIRYMPSKRRGEIVNVGLLVQDLESGDIAGTFEPKRMAVLGPIEGVAPCAKDTWLFEARLAEAKRLIGPAMPLDTLDIMHAANREVGVLYGEPQRGSHPSADIYWAVHWLHTEYLS